MLEPVVRLGVTFWLKFIFGLIVPLYKQPELPIFELVQSEKCVNVPVLVLVFCGKEIEATGLALAFVLLVPLVTDHPAVER